MSFYQPSLSLYDVLNALSNQTGQRGQQGYPRQPQRPQRYHPHYGQVHVGGHHPRHHPLYSRYNGVPNTYYYQFPGQAYYYSPEYGYDDEDGEEEDQDEDMVGDSGTTRQEDGGEDSNSRRYPSYYHCNTARNNRTNQQANSLNDLLTALIGVPPYEGTEPEIEANTEQEGEKGEEKDKKDKSEAPKEEDGETNKEKPLNQLEESSRPPLAKKSSSFAHLQAPSPIPDPLQVSKPETRMDLPFSPEVNVYDTEDTYVVVLALPGANSRAFHIDYHPSSHEMLIKGKIEDRVGIDEKFLKITELKYGAFERTVKFPVLPRIKDEEIKATYNNGLLQIKVPKIVNDTEKPKPKKRIAIEEIPDEELEFEENPNPTVEN
ncbi:AIC_G0010290.mRNA.1.CDS.1 [Saccharomyces cerevisiae]|uniref:Hsp42p n=1 Tax=Saccharomyces cerevisiae (strain Lalvin EC1118 / Prise de mousse) TaxID=643680 RepID=C8Z585_YEAS8|nr:Hsp42p [Saccharomyces cerevisiae YJM270]KAF4006563.1 Heat shock protein 42 [Saccharomyces cerevisiae]CAY78674.1 Hsp42p [Saccharomyces cerevisiae EC1118]PTN39168.1 heat shock protein HSP42 [Saccharomyces cerevisiae]CAI4337419.1 AIC_G0010290.mRNA.1.CDS.1 [Saccharomyces cerevisiae]